MIDSGRASCAVIVVIAAVAAVVCLEDEEDGFQSRKGEAEPVDRDVATINPRNTHLLNKKISFT